MNRQRKVLITTTYNELGIIIDTKAEEVAQPDLDEWCTDCKEYDDKRHCCPRWNRVIRQALKDAQPQRKKGKWIEHNPHKWGLGIIYECSECGYEMDCEEPNYCPSCGADMRGER